MIELANWNADILITSDHGNTIVSKPVKVKADNTASLGIRYKYGRNLNFSDKDVLKIKNPEDYGLSSFDVNTEYIISSDNKYFVYENQFHKYSNILSEILETNGTKSDKEEELIGILEHTLRVEGEGEIPLLIYGTEGAQDFCNAKKVAASGDAKLD